MKRLLFLILSVLSLHLQAQILSNGVITIGDTTYHTRVSDNGTVYRQAGFSVVPSINLDRSKKYPVFLAIHGVDERSNGSLTALRNAMQGFDYDGTGPNPRIPSTVFPDMLTAAINGQCIVVCINYQNECNPIDINAVLDEVEINYPVDREKEALIGFSLGGGAVVRYITSSQANADRLAFAIAAAPVSWATNWTYPKNSRLPFWGITNQYDPRVSPTNIKNMIAAFNVLNPDPAGKLIVLPGNGHGGIKEIEALNYGPQNMYDYLNGITRTNPLPYPTSTTKPPPVTDPVITVPVLKYTAPTVTSVASFELLACDSSKNFDNDKFKWCVWSVPKGANVYYPFVTSGAGFCNAKVTLTVEGAYGMWVQACKGTTCVRDTFYVTYQKGTVQVPRTVKGFDSSTGLISWSDGTTEPGVAVLSSGKWVLKNAAGTVINL